MYQKNEESLYLIWIAKNNWKWSHVRIQSIEQLMSMKKKVKLQLNLFSDAYGKVTNRNWILFNDTACSRSTNKTPVFFKNELCVF